MKTTQEAAIEADKKFKESLAKNKLPELTDNHYILGFLEGVKYANSMLNNL